MTSPGVEPESSRYSLGALPFELKSHLKIAYPTLTEMDLNRQLGVLDPSSSQSTTLKDPIWGLRVATPGLEPGPPPIH